MLQILRDRILDLENKLTKVGAMIIVWGPGADPNLQAFARKREQIRQRIRDKFPAVAVYFPEEIKDETSVFGTDALDREIAEVALCDLVICLDAGVATSTELALVQYPRLASRIVAFTPEKFAVSEDTIMTSVRKRIRKQLFFTDKEFEDCLLIEKLVLPLVRAELIRILVTR